MYKAVMNINFLGTKFIIKSELIIFILGLVIGVTLLCNCNRFSFEGFSSYDQNNGKSNDEDNGKLMDEWTSNAKKYAETNLHQDHLIRNQTYGGQNNFKKDSDLFFLTETAAKPECCPSTYSNSQGCLCMTPEQNNFLNERGDNRSHGEY